VTLRRQVRDARGEGAPIWFKFAKGHRLAVDSRGQYFSKLGHLLPRSHGVRDFRGPTSQNRSKLLRGDVQGLDGRKITLVATSTPGADSDRF
jgi:hypothetical protein